MQCSNAVLRVGVTLKLKPSICKICFVEYESDLYLPKYTRTIFEHNKI